MIATGKDKPMYIFFYLRSSDRANRRVKIGRKKGIREGGSKFSDEVAVLGAGTGGEAEGMYSGSGRGSAAQLHEARRLHEERRRRRLKLLGLRWA